MKAVLCKEFGPPETLVIGETETPKPEKGTVRIAVEACGMNFPDSLIIQNKYQFKPPLPFSPGGEVAGIVDAIGEGTDPSLLGKRVMAMTLHGGLAEYVVVPADALLPCPADMPFETAAGFTMTYGTSMHALKQRGQLRPGEVLLVLGAGGGVGLAAVEIGKQMGATVIAAASSDEKLAAARSGGAHHTINYAKEDLREEIKRLTDGRGVDVVYDPAGGDLFEAALRSTAWGGRVLVVGFASGDIPKISMNLPLLKGCAIVGVFWGAFRLRNVAEDNRNFEQLFKWYAQGGLSPLISRTYGLSDAPQAIADLQNRKAIGKIVVRVRP